MNNVNTLLLVAVNNKTALLILMIVLIAFVIMLTALGIVFIIALRKRRPVVKVVMAPTFHNEPEPEDEPVAQMAETAPESNSAEPEAQPQPEPVPVEEEEDEGDATAYVTEGHEQVRYNRSFTAKICQLSNESKEWYSELKNHLLSYDKIKDRTSWKRESFRFGRMTVARIAVRGRTLCLLLAVEPAGYEGTKYHVDDVSDMANTADTPTLYRIKSARRLKYAKEMVDGLMKELKTAKQPNYYAQDYFVPYEGDMALMQRGLVKRVVTGSTRVYKIEELEEDAQDNEVAVSDGTNADNGESN